MQVYAIDLLGFGRSSKPQMQYSMELWRDLLVDFMQVRQGGGMHASDPYVHVLAGVSPQCMHARSM